MNIEKYELGRRLYQEADIIKNKDLMVWYKQISQIEVDAINYYLIKGGKKMKKKISKKSPFYKEFNHLSNHVTDLFENIQDVEDVINTLQTKIMEESQPKEHTSIERFKEQVFQILKEVYFDLGTGSIMDKKRLMRSKAFWLIEIILSIYQDLMNSNRITLKESKSFHEYTKKINKL